MFILSLLSRGLGVPVGVSFDHRIEYVEEFPHAGHEDDFEEFA